MRVYRKRKPLAERLRIALGELHDQTDEDCPAEYRTKHLRDAMEEARDLCKEFDTKHKRRRNA